MIGFAFIPLWNVNRTVALVGMICFLAIGIALLFIGGYFATKKERTRLLALIPTHEYSCIELTCPFSFDKLQKYGKKCTVDLDFYGNEIAPQTLVKIKELSSTEEEDAAFRDSKLGSTTVSLSEISELNGIPFLISDTLYEMLNQIPDCAEFIKNNEFTIFHDTWSSHAERTQ